MLDDPDNLHLAIRPTDRAFEDGPAAGAPECLCSRCGRPIRAGCCPVRFWELRDWPRILEWRYHPKCLGFGAAKRWYRRVKGPRRAGGRPAPEEEEEDENRAAGASCTPPPCRSAPT
jgi:hypothetical protein